MRDGFIFYESFRDAMKELPAESQLLIYNSIADYALYDIEPDFGNDGTARGFFKLVRPQIDANIRKRENGARGGRPTNSDPTDITEAEPKANLDGTKAEPSKNQDITEAEPKANAKAKGKAKGNGNAKGKGAGAPLELIDPLLSASIREFKAFRVKLKKPMTERAVSMLITKLNKLAPGNIELQIAIINQSIYKGWQDVYELNDNSLLAQSKGRFDHLARMAQEFGEEDTT